MKEEVSYLVDEIGKIIGVKYVLVFEGNVLAIDFDKHWVNDKESQAHATSSIKRIVHEHGFNMFTTKNLKDKKIISLIPMP